MQRKLLAFASIVEIITGLAFVIAPAMVVTLLLGAGITGLGVPLGRCFGITLVALGLACWPGRSGESASPAFHGMLAYNVLTALFLLYLIEVEHLGGALVWPAVAIHAAVAMLLIWTWRTGRRREAHL